MSGRPFTISSAISLLFCAATVALWVRSFRTADGFDKYVPGRTTLLYSAGGRIEYYDQDDRELARLSMLSEPGGLKEHVPPPGWSFESMKNINRPDSGDETWFNRMGIFAEWRIKVPMSVFSTKPIFETNTQLIFPHWLVALTLAFLPAAWIAMRIRRSSRLRAARGHCVVCGYDLRASTERCPECGTAIVSKADALA